jgi:glycosyltransferase involved in cell wall biosynthesis
LTAPEPARAMPSASPPPARTTSPLKVVMIIPYDLQRQPFTIRTIRFAEELARRGHQVTVFHHTKLGAFARNQPVLVHPEFPKGVQVELLNGITRFDARVWARVGAAIKDADVVHFQKSLHSAAVPAMTFARLYDKPLHQDWDDYESLFWWQSFKDANARGATMFVRAATLYRTAATTAMEWLIPKVVDTIGTSARELRERSVALGADPGDVFSSRVGVDADVFTPEARDLKLREKLGLGNHPTVLYAGSLDIETDLRFFTEALKTLFAHAPEARCLVVGAGFGRPRFVQMLEENGLKEKVKLTEGFVPFAEMPRYLASCDIAALPFRDTRINRAKSSLTLMECMAAGLPVVTHDVGDMAWIADSGGVIARLDDAEAFGRALAELVNNTARRTELGKKGRQRTIEQFSWQHSVDHLEAAYRAAIDRRRGNK